MPRFLFLLLILVWPGLGSAAHAASVTLAWNPSDGVAGYLIAYGTRSGVYSTTVDVGNVTRYSIDGLQPGTTYFFVVHAYSFARLVSAPSNEVSTTVPVVVRSGRLTYNPATGAWSDPPVDRRGQSPVTSPGWIVTTADFNGDGFPDLLLYNPVTGAWYKATDNKDGTYTFFGYRWAPGWTPYIADFDGDGRSDVFLYNRSTGAWFRCMTIGNGDFAYFPGTWRPGWDITPADLNGDGRSDLFLYGKGAPNRGLWFRVLSDADGQFSYVPGDVRWADDWQITPVDFDGNGRSDLFLYRANGQWFRVYFEQHGTRYVGGQWAPGWTILAGNFDPAPGSELFLYSPRTGQWFVVTIDAGGEFDYHPGLWGTGWTIQTADFNNDGLTDLLLYHVTRGNWFEAMTLPSGEFHYRTGTGPTGEHLLVLR